MFSMLAMGETVATFFILPRARIHNLLQLERFLSVRDFNYPYKVVADSFLA
jgi:hypothetical protein